VLGGPKVLNNNTYEANDFRSLFQEEILSGNYVIEEIKDDHAFITTNRHLMVFDIGWLGIMMVSWWSLIYIWRIYETPRWITILLLLYIYLTIPLFGLKMTNLRYISRPFDLCEVVDEPRMGLRLTLSAFSFITFNHFLLLNDIIRMRCPSELIKFKEGYLPVTKLKPYNDHRPSSLYIVHNATFDWWENIRPDVWDFRRRREAVAKIKKEDCIDKHCIWGDFSNVVGETKEYYLLNSTLLPGHSGLACRENIYDSKYYGIVQYYHPVTWLNICTKANPPDALYLSPYIFIFGPHFLLLVVYLIQNSTIRFYVISYTVLVYVLRLKEELEDYGY
jgi:hypothetical protein